MITNFNHLTEDYRENRCILRVYLSDGTTLYENNDKFWVQVKSYIKEKSLKITGIAVSFRDNVIDLPKNADGYYFSYGLLASVGSKNQSNFYICGHQRGDIIHCTWFKTPELIVYRQLSKKMAEAGPDQLISNA